MQADNHIIHGLWIGKRLSPIELLTLHSFLQKGHQFHLWVYEELETVLPKGIVLRDANHIIPFEQVFRKKSNDPTNQLGANSFGAPFSDLFRYKLLYEHGGWWVDMDVTALQALDIEQPYFFRAHPILPMVGNVMKCPKGSELMKAVYEEVKRVCDENTIDWLLPNRILNQHIERLQLQKYIQSGISNQDNWEEVRGLLYQQKPLPVGWRCIHWMNEEWRSQGLDKSKIYAPSTLAQLLKQYNIPFTKISFIAKRYPWLVKKLFRASPFYPIYRWAKYG